MIGAFETVIKMSVVLIIGLAATALLRRGSAALRHSVIGATIVCAGAVPVVGVVVPAWHVQRAAVAAAPASDVHTTAEVAAPRGRVTGMGQPAGMPATVMNILGDFVMPIWVAGAFLNLGALCGAMFRLNRIASRARVVREGPWAVLSARMSETLGATRPIRLLMSDHPALLVTWGLRAAKVLLPIDAEAWSDERKRVVLAHELAHVVRGDWVVQIGAELLRCLYWFHPLLWLACRRLRLESEHACDDVVMQIGIESGTYATHLLEIARSIHARRAPPFPAPAMAGRPSTLERRVSAMLNHRLNHAPLTRVGRWVPALALLALTLPVATFAQGTFGSVYGVVVDPMDRLLPNTTIVVSDAQRNVRHEVHADRDGRFELIGLPAGAYVMEAITPGFSPIREAFTISGQAVERNLKLEVGSLQETITVTGSPGTVGTDAAPPRTAQRRVIPPCPAVASPVGGNIRSPRKVRDVRPIYPGVDGHVTLAARIATDGSVAEVRVLKADRPELEAPAVTAVSQWEFDETLLNCVPVEVRMNVDVDFRPEQ